MKFNLFKSTVVLPAWVLLNDAPYTTAMRLKGMQVPPPPPPPPPPPSVPLPGNPGPPGVSPPKLKGMDPPPPPPPPDDPKKEDKGPKEKEDGDCPPPPPPGPPKPNNDGTYEEGVNRGMHEAGKIWHDGGCDCVNVWGYKAEVEVVMDANFGDADGDTEQQAEYKRGVSEGAKVVVDEHERECLDASPDECNELGEAAAMQIAFEFCPFTMADATGYEDEPDYRQACREVAYVVCKSKIGGMVDANGCDLTTSDEEVLQEECVGVIDELTPDGEDDAVYEITISTDLPVAEI